MFSDLSQSLEVLHVTHGAVKFAEAANCMVHVSLVIEHIWALVVNKLSIIQVLLHETIDHVLFLVLVLTTARWAGLVNGEPLLDTCMAGKCIAF